MKPSTALCHRCGAEIPFVGRVGRRDICSVCGSDLHCCLNCRFYAPGHHNDCREPGADRQVDKEVGNFCDYFELRRGERGEQPEGNAVDARARLEALFRKGQT